MKSLEHINEYPENLPVRADDIIEFHAARLVLLFWLCGKDGKIEGLTKMAKLDFFVRYPQFFVKACSALKKSTKFSYNTVESSMIRYHYGPWDQRYYHVLAYLEARGILKVSKEGKAYNFILTDLGKSLAMQLSGEPSFQQIVFLMQQVQLILGGKTGTQLKKLVYTIFDDEVAKLSLSEVIK